MGRPKINLLNKKFGRLTVVDFGKSRQYGDKASSKPAYWICKCDCGNFTEVCGLHLRNGTSQSCGCLRKELYGQHLKTHGMTNTSTFKVWISMIQRCTNSKNKRYKDWGGRGITVTEKWLNSFENFLNDMGEKPKGMSIDRINNNLGYFKENCRWATPKEQANNRRPFNKWKQKRNDDGYWYYKNIETDKESPIFCNRRLAEKWKKLNDEKTKKEIK